MADISKIQIESGIYNIKDTTARDTINNYLNGLKRKYIFIGDSYGELQGQQTWIDIVIGKLGLTENDYYRSTLGSTGFKNYNASTSERFINLLQNVANNLSQAEKDKITDIIVCGGANDSAYSTASEIETYVNDFMSYASTTFQNAVVYVGCIGYTMNIDNKYNMQNVIESYKSVVKYGGVYLNGVENAIHNYSYFLNNGAWLLSDQVHPNQDGSTRIGIAVYDAYKYGYAGVSMAMTKNSTDIGFNYIYSSQNNDIYTMYIKDELTKNIQSEQFICSPTRNPIDLCDVAPTVVGGFASDKALKFPARAILRCNTEDVYIDGWISIVAYTTSTQIRNKLVFYPNVYDTISGTGVGGYKVYANPVYLIIQPMVMKFTNFEC